MKYALGNMLNGAGGLNPDGLALDLQFAADKSLVARKGPTPTFTRASSGTFVGSNGLIQSAATNTPRFEHDPVTLASRGLLIEESRTNLILQSENHASATWNKTGGSVSSVANIAPNGDANSYLFSEDASTGAHRVFQSTAYVTGTVYTISVFLKYAGRQFIAISHPAVASNNAAIFDIQNGLVTLTQSGVTSAITQHPNGWWRCSITGTSTVTSSQSHLIQGSTSGTTVSISYAGLDGSSFYIYGSQVEAGSFPTSYIPTTTTSIVRSADVCSISNTSSFWNNNQFTVYSNANILASGIDGYVYNFQITSGFFGCRRPTTNIATAIIRSSGANADLSFGTIATGIAKMALAYSIGERGGSCNGSVTQQSSTAFVPSSNPVLQIGNSNGSAGFINGHIASISYFRKRLTNAKLQAITV